MMELRFDLQTCPIIWNMLDVNWLAMLCKNIKINIFTPGVEVDIR